MFDQILFLLSGSLTVFGAIFVVVSKNLMRSCIFLLASLLGVAGLYVTLGADLLAATQLIVYAGGIVILMLFAVMLTGGAENKSNRFGVFKTPGMGSFKTYFLALFVVITFALVTFKVVLNLLATQGSQKAQDFLVTVEDIGTSLITDHILAFEISSILLLGALVGASVIARPRKSS